MALTPDPTTILGKAIRAVPAVKYALGVAGVIAVIAIVVGGWKIDPRVAVFGFIVMIVLMTILAIFAKMPTAALALGAPLLVVVWTSVVLFVATAGALFLSVFFDWPVPLKTRVFPKDDAKSSVSPPAQLQGSPVQSTTQPGEKPSKPQSTSSLAQFVGTWESDEMDEDPVVKDTCMEDATKKLYLDILKTPANKFIAKLRSVITGSIHTTNKQYLPGPACTAGTPLVHKEKEYSTSIEGVDGKVLSLGVEIPPDKIIVQFRLDNNRLIPVHEGFDMLVNNTNRATYEGKSPLAFYRPD